MQRSIWILLILMGFSQVYGQSPHGESYKTDCALCHNPSGWVIDIDTFQFKHDTTSFILEGTHLSVDCKACHTSLVFGEAPSDCLSCHTDVHSMSVGNDCARCHTAQSWLVDNIPELHEENGFPLVGSHSNLSCVDCHFSETNLRFDRIGNDCINCHLEDYLNAENPEHNMAGFSTDCFNCHTPEQGWQSSNAPNHDAEHFPIYSGTHEGVWTACTDCHINPSDYSQFSCTVCHINPETDNTHNGISGYAYEDQACYACHPTGEGLGNFDHNLTHFPLTGSHIGVECIQCHAAGYAGTPTECVACHTEDFNNTTNPNHTELNFPMDCAQCHTTDPGWMPATFDIHDQYHPLNGAHAAIANNCAECHNGDYNNTPNTCVGCHLDDFNNTTNPDHEAANYSTDCAQCHSETSWTPSTFDHDSFFPLVGQHTTVDCNGCHIDGNFSNTPTTCVGCHLDDYNDTSNPNHAQSQFPTDCTQCHSESGWTPATFDHDDLYFPIYSGNHKNEWDTCSDCHTNGSDYSVFSCIDCHEHDNPTSLENKHNEENVDGYVYQSAACYNCHPNGH